jgi:hypothetical protein
MNDLSSIFFIPSLHTSCTLMELAQALTRLRNVKAPGCAATMQDMEPSNHCPKKSCISSLVAVPATPIDYGSAVSFLRNTVHCSNHHNEFDHHFLKWCVALGRGHEMVSDDRQGSPGHFLSTSVGVMMSNAPGCERR